MSSKDHTNDIAVAIEIHKQRIIQHEKAIKYHTEAILRLQGKTEICPHCNGEGKVMTVHRFMGPHVYTKCLICKGTGKLTKEELETLK